ncbi:MAG: hypothetical protein HFI75_06450 [Lachnospiraceae bacterium]|nr:hypothetical protein [Lachnospiraceae bacterium]
MEKKHLQKGMYGFHAYKKKTEIIKTLILFGIALAVYFTGLLHTKTNKNLLTVVAIVGMLPASKSAVSMLMFLRFKSAAASLHDQLTDYWKQSGKQGILLYDLILVIKEKVVKTDCIWIQNTTVLVYTVNTQLSQQDISKELKNFLSNHGKGGCTIKVCKTEKTFLEFLKNHSAEEPEEQAVQNQEKIREMLLGYSM